MVYTYFLHNSVQHSLRADEIKPCLTNQSIFIVCTQAKFNITFYVFHDLSRILSYGILTKELEKKFHFK